MKEYLQNIRNQIYYDSWEKYKGRLTMEELAIIFNVPLVSAYKIIKRKYDNTNNNTNNNSPNTKL